MHRTALICLLAVAIHATSGVVQLPSNFKTCRHNSPNYNECLKAAVQSAIRDLVQGSRPLGVLPIDPLQVTSLTIDQGSGPVAVKLDFKNLMIHGISGAVVSSVVTDLRAHKLSITAKVPRISLRSRYTIKGQVLVLPISGSGNCDITLSESDVTIDFTGHEVTKDGVTYLAFTNLQFGLNPKRVQMYFENLFNGDKALGENMNTFLNDNAKEVYGELKAPIQNAFGATILDMANRIFSKVPYNVIFPN